MFRVSSVKPSNHKSVSLTSGGRDCCGFCWICGGSGLPELQAKRHRWLMSVKGEKVCGLGPVWILFPDWITCCLMSACTEWWEKTRKSSQYKSQVWAGGVCDLSPLCTVKTRGTKSTCSVWNAEVQLRLMWSFGSLNYLNHCVSASFISQHSRAPPNTLSVWHIYMETTPVIVTLKGNFTGDHTRDCTSLSDHFQMFVRH